MDGQRLSDAVRAYDNIPNFKRNFLKNGVLDKVYGAKVEDNFENIRIFEGKSFF